MPVPLAPRPYRWRPSRPGRLRSVALVVLVALALVLALVLPVDALRLLRERRAVAQAEARARLEDAAHIVAERIGANLSEILRDVLLPAMASSGPLPEAPPSLERFVERVARDLERCWCVPSDGYAFRERVPGRLEAMGPADPALTRWLRDTLPGQLRLRHARVWHLHRKPLTTSAEIGPEIGTFVTGILVTPPPLDSRLLTYIAFVLPNGAPGPVYGVELDEARFLPHLLRAALRPVGDDDWSDVASGSPYPLGWLDSAADSGTRSTGLTRWPYAVSISDATGRELYRTEARRPARPGTVVRLPAGYARLVVETYVRPGALAGDPGQAAATRRLWTLAGMFVVTVGLLALGVVQLRREAEIFELRARFVSGVSHELRTPLAQIRLFAELLRTSSPRGRSAKQDDYARIIDEEAQRLTHLVENILTFSALNHSARRLLRERLDLSAEVAQTVEAFAPLARIRKAELHTDVEPDVHASGDRDSLRQVLLNLLSNAVKYGPEGQLVRVRLVERGGVACLTVEDEGPGIPAGERERIFTPFYRLARDVEAASGGSGIGLAVVRELVGLHDGRVEVETAPGGGARFAVMLPTGASEPRSSGGAPTASHAAVAGEGA